MYPRLQPYVSQPASEHECRHAAARVPSGEAGQLDFRLSDLVSDLDLVCNLDLVGDLEQPARPQEC